MFSIRTEWTDVAGRLMHEPMAYHFVFTLESLSALATGTAGNGTVVRAALRVDVCV